MCAPATPQILARFLDIQRMAIDNFWKYLFFYTARILETDSLDFKFYMSCGSWALSFDIQKGI